MNGARFTQRGYEPCACCECMEIAIGKSYTAEPAFCHACQGAGCENSLHCQREPEPEFHDSEEIDAP